MAGLTYVRDSNTWRKSIEARNCFHSLIISERSDLLKNIEEEEEEGGKKNKKDIKKKVKYQMCIINY